MRESEREKGANYFSKVLKTENRTKILKSFSHSCPVSRVFVVRACRCRRYVPALKIKNFFLFLIQNYPSFMCKLNIQF